jgi:lipopolysaccharide export system permease protein
VTILDRHIFRSAFFTCLAAMVVFAFVLVAGNVVRDVIGQGLLGQISWTQFARFTLLLIPYVAAYALPMGMLTGVLLTLGRLSADSEITAMRAAGLSVPRIALPIFLLGLLGAATAIPTNFRWMPWAAVEKEKELADLIRANPLNYIVPKTFIYDFPGSVVYVGRRQGGDLKDIWIWKTDERMRATSLWHADSGHLDFDEEAFAFILTLHGVMAETFDERNVERFAEPPKVAVSESWDPMRLPLSQLLGREPAKQKLQWMTYSELEHEEARRAAVPLGAGGLKARVQSVLQAKLTLVGKFNTILAVFSFCFIGIPLGIKVSRRETSANLGLAVALALGYQFLSVAVSWLDRRPDLRPEYLLWLPNILILGLGIILFRRIDQPASR